jgi:hypothetical protein
VRILSIMTIDPSQMTPPTAEEMATMGAFIEELRAEGKLVDTGGALPGQLEMKIQRSGEKYTVTDGPFTEAKEVVGGYALFDVASRDEAVALTRRFLDLAGNATCHLHEVSVFQVA